MVLAAFNSSWTIPSTTDKINVFETDTDANVNNSAQIGLSVIKTLDSVLLSVEQFHLKVGFTLVPDVQLKKAAILQI